MSLGSANCVLLGPLRRGSPLDLPFTPSAVSVHTRDPLEFVSHLGGDCYYKRTPELVCG